MSNEKNVTMLSEDAKKVAANIEQMDVGPIGDAMALRLDFRHPDRVSILVAPDGCGKSLIFRLLRDYINGNIVNPSLYPREYNIEGYANRAILIAPLDGEYGVQRHGLDIYVNDPTVGKTVAELYNKTFDLLRCSCTCVECTIKCKNQMPEAGTTSTKTVYKLKFRQNGHRRYFFKSKNHWQLSTGEKVWLAVMCAVYDSHPDDLILLDAPETGMHVEAQDCLIDNILAVPHRGQVIVATQSPNIINIHIDKIAHKDIWYISDAERQEGFINWGK